MTCSWEPLPDPDAPPPKAEPGLTELFSEIRVTVDQEAQIITAVFPSPPAVMQTFLQRVFAQVVRVGFSLSWIQQLTAPADPGLHRDFDPHRFVFIDTCIPAHPPPLALFDSQAGRGPQVARVLSLLTCATHPLDCIWLKRCTWRQVEWTACRRPTDADRNHVRRRPYRLDCRQCDARPGTRRALRTLHGGYALPR